MGDSIETLRQKLENLLRRQQQVEKDKANAAATYNDELKDIKGEIKDTLVAIDSAE